MLQSLLFGLVWLVRGWSEKYGKYTKYKHILTTNKYSQ